MLQNTFRCPSHDRLDLKPKGVVMKKFNVLSSVFILLLTGCASIEQPDISSHWTVQNGAREIVQLQQLEDAGVIQNLTIMESSPEQISASGPARVIGCLENNGTWLQEHQECEFIGESQCTALEGAFNECASACRHDPDAMMCIQMCVPVCSFESE